MYFFSLFVEDRNEYGILVDNIVMTDSSTFVQSVENPQHNVDVYINSLFCQNVFYFVDGNTWHLGKMVDIDIMVTRNFFWH